MPASLRRLTIRSAGSLLRALSTSAAGEAAIAALALIALAAALAGNPEWLVLTLALLSLAGTVGFGWERRRLSIIGRSVEPTGSYVLARVLILLAAAVALSSEPAIEPGSVLVCGVLLGLALVAELVVSALGEVACPYAAHLPGINVRNYPVFAERWVFTVNTAGVALLLALATVAQSVRELSIWLVLLPGIVALLVVGAVLGDALLRLKSRRSAERMLPQALAAYAPAFLLYWEAPPGSLHQIEMWLPYLSRLNRPYLVVLRTPDTFAETAAVASVPVIVRRYVSELDVLITPTLKTAFFVNTAPKNAHMVHYIGINQIQLNHGDSDKAPSYRRVFRMYDKNFVAGQAAIDRFSNNGVVVPRDAFEIVGRPQVEGVKVQEVPIATRKVPRVLYAPTWYGYLEDSRYSSLPIGLKIVQALIDRGCVVLFRPHPWVWRTPNLASASRDIDGLLAADAAKTGRSHIFGPAAVTGSILDTFNKVDALISDVSSVIPDFLYSEKPFAVTSMVAEMTIEGFLADFPLARAGYVLASDLSNLDSVLQQLLAEDQASALRRRLKTYYLGDFPAESYAAGFLRAAQKYL
jgi:CDP-Glycerol:Poly(glycerophosphate) glycerophosphotransferase